MLQQSMPAASQWLSHGAEAVFSSDFLALAQWVDELRDLFVGRCGYDAIYLGGGSSRSILDHVLWDRLLTMRDLDLFVVAHRQATENDIWTIVRETEHRGLAELGKNRIRLKRRVNPELPLLERSLHNAGFGFHMRRDGMPILSLSVYHSLFDLNLNGILSFDRILIKLGAATDLATFARGLRQHLAATGKIEHPSLIDPSSGYADWLTRRIVIENFAEVEAKPVMCAIRIVRSHAKLGYLELPAELAAWLRSFVEGGAAWDQLEVVRFLLKVLTDEFAPHELSMLRDVGVLGLVAPRLDQLIGDGGPEQAQRIVASFGSTQSASSQLELLEEFGVAIPEGLDVKTTVSV